MDPLSQGRDFYGRKDYEGALKAFTEASPHDLRIVLPFFWALSF
jgi:hypothetical protein